MQNSTSSKTGPLIILGALFFIFGFVTWLNATLIPYLKIACELTTQQAMLVAFAFYISYFVTALPSSRILQKTGFKKGMMLGLLVMAIGALIFIPAATTRTYALFLTGLFVIGTGLSILQTAVNPYVTIIGPIESAAKRISIMGICNKVAGVIVPLIMGAILLKGADELIKQIKIADLSDKIILLDELANRLISPSLVLAGIFLLFMIFLSYSKLPEINTEENNESKSISGTRSIWQHTNLVLGVFAIFLYVGAEVIAVDTLGTYGDSLGIPLSEAKNFPSYTLAAMVIGYIIGIFTIPKYISQAKALAVSAIVGVIFSVLAIFTEGYISVLFIALLGLANALMWPAIWPLAIDGLGKFIKTGSALLIMAIAGGAILPQVYGYLADMPDVGSRSAYWIMVPCYIFILYYAVKGHKIQLRITN